MLRDDFEQSNDGSDKGFWWKRDMEKAVEAEKQYQRMIERVTGTEESQTL